MDSSSRRLRNARSPPGGRPGSSKPGRREKSCIPDSEKNDIKPRGEEERVSGIYLIVGVLTALDVEYDAVREEAERPASAPAPARNPFRGRPTRGRADAGSRSALVGKGNQSAAVLAERAIAEFYPAAVLFVGVAGALAEHPARGRGGGLAVYAYHGGTSEDDGLKGRPRVVGDRAWRRPSCPAGGAQRGWAGNSGGPGTPTVHFGANRRRRGGPGLGGLGSGALGRGSTTTTRSRSRWRPPGWPRRGISTGHCRWSSSAASATGPTAPRPTPTESSGRPGRRGQCGGVRRGARRGTRAADHLGRATRERLERNARKNDVHQHGDRQRAGRDPGRADLLGNVTVGAEPRAAGRPRDGPSPNSGS